MHDRALRDPCVFVCVCANKTCVSAERYEVHLTKAPVTDVHGNVKYRLGVTQTHRETEGRRVMKGEDDETKERIEQTLGELFTLYYYIPPHSDLLTFAYLWHCITFEFVKLNTFK